MRSILLFWFCFLGALPCFAQATCALPTPPVLLGLRLEMSPEQAQSVFGGDLKISFKTKDEKTIFENYINKSAPPRLAGVRALYLRFFDRRLYQIEVFYEERSDRATLESFVAALSADLQIPPELWKNERGRSEIICPGFSLVAHKTLNPRIELTNETARKQVEDLRREREKN